MSCVSFLTDRGSRDMPGVYSRWKSKDMSGVRSPDRHSHTCLQRQEGQLGCKGPQLRLEPGREHVCVGMHAGNKCGRVPRLAQASDQLPRGLAPPDHNDAVPLRLDNPAMHMHGGGWGFMFWISACFAACTLGGVEQHTSEILIVSQIT